MTAPSHVIGIPLSAPPQDKYHFNAASYTREVTFYAEGRAPFVVCVNPESIYHASIFCHLAEIEVKTRFWRGFKPGDCVLDAGHGFGAYCFPPAALGAEVWGIDPEGTEETYLAFKMSIDRNIERRNFKAPFKVKRAFLGATNQEPGPPALPTLSIDSLERPFTHINLDTEGAELEILHGAERTIREHHPKFLLENHLFIDADCEKKHDEFLAQFGYVKRASIPEGACTHSFYEVTP